LKTFPVSFKLPKIHFENSSERQTFILYLAYTFIDGILLGALALNEYILIKGLKGTSYQIGLLFLTSVVVLLLSVPFNEIYKRTANKKRLLRITGIITRAPLLLLIFFPEKFTGNHVLFTYQMIFLIIFLLFYFINPLIMPAINGYLKTNFTHENFGKFYGYATTVNKIVMLIVTFLFGVLLDLVPDAYRFVYPFLGVLGIISIFILTKIRYTPPVIPWTKPGLFKALNKTVKNMSGLLKRDRSFKEFEVGFMLYGFAWLMTVGVITIFLENEMKLNYSGVAFYKNLYNTISILLTPFFGKLMGKMHPQKFAVYTFIFMLFYILFMGLAEYFPARFEVFGIKIYYALLISFISYGIFGAMMGIIWNIGSAYFAKDEHAGDYQSVHLSLTGFRGAFATVAGIFFYELIGFTGVFALAIVSLLCAVFYLRNKLSKQK
jgi:hypothetical protein